MNNFVHKMTGGNKATSAALFWTVVFLVASVVILACLGVFEGYSATNAPVTDYDCDIRIGCNTRDLTQRETSNILLDRAQRMEAGREGFDLSLFQPGVDRPYITQLQIDNKLRSEDIIEGLTGRSHSDYVFQQFGNDGTVINPSVNPLFRPARHITGFPASA